MIAIPAVDLRGGACVQLVGGSYDQERVRLPDPCEVARDWARLGFPWLHVVDLDAATGRGSNRELVAELLRDGGARIQVGGGVRGRDDVDRLLDSGAGRVVVGTRALEEPAWLDEMASLFPDKLVVAADVRGRRVLAGGWARALDRDVTDVVVEMNSLPLAGVLVTAVHREGQLAGTDLPLFEAVIEASTHPVYASGGITTIDDLRALDTAGVAGAVVGMALYTGALDARAVAEEFTEEVMR